MSAVTRRQTRSASLRAAEDVPVADVVEESESSSASSDASEDDEDSSTDDEEDSDTEDVLDALFEKSLAALREREKSSKGKGKAAFADDEDVIALAEPVRASADEATSGPSRPKSKLSNKEFDAVYADVRSGKTAEAANAKVGKAAQRERRAERERTAGSRWFDMPAFGGSSESGKRKQTGSSLTEAEERKARRARLTNPDKHDGDGRGPSTQDMRREVQAIRLRNAIDPKRFYRGSASGDREMPKYAQLGRIISSSSAPAATLNRSERGRTVIEELVRDAEAAAYAKKKFNEHQAKSNVAWSSHVRRHPKRGKGSGRSRK